jgi:hypothetical protein
VGQSKALRLSTLKEKLFEAHISVASPAVAGQSREMGATQMEPFSACAMDAGPRRIALRIIIPARVITRVCRIVDEKVHEQREFNSLKGTLRASLRASRIT